MPGPVTSILLIPNCPLDPEYNHTMRFAGMGEYSSHTIDEVKNLEVQHYQYFEGIQGVKRLDNSSYQRVSSDGGVVRVACSMEETLYYNYLAIYNAVPRFDFDNAGRVLGAGAGYDTGVTNIKAYFAFITDVTYVNDACCDIHFKIDVFQTWGFRMDFDCAFVERAHVRDDSVGIHTIPEGIDCGTDIVVDGFYPMGNINEFTSAGWAKGMCIVILASKLSDKTALYLTAGPACIKIFENTSIAFGVYNSLKVIAIDLSADEGITVANTVVEDYVSSGHEDYIQAIYSIPSYMMSASEPSETSWGWVPATAGKLYPYTKSYTVRSKDLAGEVPNCIPRLEVDGHNVHNNKLYSYPYCYLLVSNNCGEVSEFKLENWKANTGVQPGDLKATFKLVGVGSGTPMLKLIPTEHRGLAQDLDSACNYTRFPECAWVGDAWAAYWAQNKTTAAQSILSMAVGGGASAMMLGEGSKFSPSMRQNYIRETARIQASHGMGVSALRTLTALPGPAKAAGTAVGTSAGITAALAKSSDLANTPPQVHGQVMNDSFNVATANVGFKVMGVHVREEYMRYLDWYFDVYGYKVNYTGIPNIHARKHYTFLKTEGMQITGPIPGYANDEACKAFDRGITWWVDWGEIGNYTKRALTGDTSKTVVEDNTPLGTGA